MCSIVDVEILIINALKKCIYSSILTHQLLYLLNSALDESGWHRPEVFLPGPTSGCQRMPNPGYKGKEAARWTCNNIKDHYEHI